MSCNDFGPQWMVLLEILVGFALFAVDRDTSGWSSQGVWVMLGLLAAPVLQLWEEIRFFQAGPLAGSEPPFLGAGLDIAHSYASCYADPASSCRTAPEVLLVGAAVAPTTAALGASIVAILWELIVLAMSHILPTCSEQVYVRVHAAPDGGSPFWKRVFKRAARAWGAWLNLALVPLAITTFRSAAQGTCDKSLAAWWSMFVLALVCCVALPLAILGSASVAELEVTAAGKPEASFGAWVPKRLVLALSASAALLPRQPWHFGIMIGDVVAVAVAEIGRATPGGRWLCQSIIQLIFVMQVLYMMAAGVLIDLPLQRYAVKLRLALLIAAEVAAGASDASRFWLLLVIFGVIAGISWGCGQITWFDVEMHIAGETEQHKGSLAHRLALGSAFIAGTSKDKLASLCENLQDEEGLAISTSSKIALGCLGLADAGCQSDLQAMAGLMTADLFEIAAQVKAKEAAEKMRREQLTEGLRAVGTEKQQKDMRSDPRASGLDATREQSDAPLPSEEGLLKCDVVAVISAVPAAGAAESPPQIFEEYISAHAGITSARQKSMTYLEKLCKASHKKSLLTALLQLPPAEELKKTSSFVRVDPFGGSVRFGASEVSGISEARNATISVQQGGRERHLRVESHDSVERWLAAQLHAGGNASSSVNTNRRVGSNASLEERLLQAIRSPMRGPARGVAPSMESVDSIDLLILATKPDENPETAETRPAANGANKKEILLHQLAILRVQPSSQNLRPFPHAKDIMTASISDENLVEDVLRKLEAGRGRAEPAQEGLSGGASGSGSTSAVIRLQLIEDKSKEVKEEKENYPAPEHQSDPGGDRPVVEPFCDSEPKEEQTSQAAHTALEKELPRTSASPEAAEDLEAQWARYRARQAKKASGPNKYGQWLRQEEGGRSLAIFDPASAGILPQQ